MRYTSLRNNSKYCEKDRNGEKKGDENSSYRTKKVSNSPEV